jgi:hypothetical protein
MKLCWGGGGLAASCCCNNDQCTAAAGHMHNCMVADQGKP